MISPTERASSVDSRGSSIHTQRPKKEVVSSDDTDRETLDSDVSSGASRSSSASRGSQEPSPVKDPMDAFMDAFIDGCKKVSDSQGARKGQIQDWDVRAKGLIQSFKDAPILSESPEFKLLRMRVDEFKKILKKEEEEKVELILEELEKLHHHLNKGFSSVVGETLEELKSFITTLKTRRIQQDQKRIEACLNADETGKPVLEGRVTTHFSKAPTIKHVALAFCCLGLLVWIAKQSLDCGYRNQCHSFTSLGGIFGNNTED